jgi:AcrR family transcriptional regulator
MPSQSSVRNGRAGTDARALRTRAALQQAFNQLMLERGYDAITPSVLAHSANVGRSTFYEHFRNVDEVLAVSISQLLAPIAAGMAKPDMDLRTVSIVQHFWENRRIARTVLSGGVETVVGRLFAAQVEAAFAGLPRRHGIEIRYAPARLAAAQVASGTLALIGAWLAGRASATADQVARSVHAGGYAAARTLGAGVDPIGRAATRVSARSGSA